MSRLFNFAAGPATLPLEILEQARDELIDWHGSGMSVMEISHRSRAFIAVAQEAEADLRELLSIPTQYKVLFMQGGASAQFAAIPMNLAASDSTVDYVNTGAWSKKALNEAKRYATVNLAADAAASSYNDVPAQSQWQLTPGAVPGTFTINVPGSDVCLGQAMLRIHPPRTALSPSLGDVSPAWIFEGVGQP